MGYDGPLFSLEKCQKGNIMASQQITTGKDVLSFCTKCKLNLAHTIVAMKDAKSIAKVKCNTCTTIQSFKDPSTSSANKTRTKKSATSTAKGNTKIISISDLWMEKLNKTTTKSQPYGIDQKYKEGDVIDHTKFGPGIVQNVKASTIEVVFRHEIKTLVHNKSM
jgi:hypothetical protein